MSMDAGFGVREAAIIILYTAYEMTCSVSREGLDAILAAARTSNISLDKRWIGGPSWDEQNNKNEHLDTVYDDGDAIWQAMLDITGISPVDGLITLRGYPVMDVVAWWLTVVDKYPGFRAIVKQTK